MVKNRKVQSKNGKCRKFSQKIKVFEKVRNVVQTIETFKNGEEFPSKNQNIAQKSKYCSKIKILLKNRNVAQNFELKHIDFRKSCFLWNFLMLKFRPPNFGERLDGTVDKFLQSFGNYNILEHFFIKKPKNGISYLIFSGKALR